MNDKDREILDNLRTRLIQNLTIEEIDRYNLMCCLDKLEHYDDTISKTIDALYKQFEEKCCNGCGFAMKCVDEDGSKNYEYSKCFKYYTNKNCSNAEKTFLKTQFGWDF